MKSRWIVNLVLLTTVGVLALIALYEPGIAPPPAAQAITALKQAQIDSVRIQRAQHADLILARRAGDAWVIEGQTTLPADRYQVGALIRLAEQTAVRSYPAAELDLARLALDPPQASVTLDATQVDFGATEALEGLRYVRVGDQVHLSPDLYQHLIDAEFTQFVRRRLLPEQAAINSLRLPALTLEKDDHGWIVQPQQDVSADRIQQLIDNWQQASALSVRSAAADTAGERIEVVLNDPAQPIVFLIAARDPDLVLLRPDLGLAYRMGASGDSLLAFPQPAAEQAQ